jgi:hypothetical protein
MNKWVEIAAAVFIIGYFALAFYGLYRIAEYLISLWS